MQRLFSVKIFAVERCLLSNHDQFLNTGLRQIPRLCEKFLHRHAPVASAYLGYDTVSTVFFTPLRYFQIFICAACCDETPRIHIGKTVDILKRCIGMPPKHLIQSIRYLIIAGGSEYGIHFRDLLPNFFLIALCKASRHNQRLCPSVRTVLRHIQYRLDALFPGIVNETAGIYNNDVCSRLIVCDGIPPVLQ